MGNEEILQEKYPLELLNSWLDTAAKSTEINFFNAMVLATVNSENAPSTRIVLLKSITQEGFVFYTNYNSQKSTDLTNNKQVAANIFWDQLNKQVNITGEVEILPRKDSQNYWSQRPRESQISQFASHQSQPVDSGQKMNNIYKQVELDYSGQTIPCPDHWGGYLLRPKSIEFWVGKTNRFHDRFKFTLTTNKKWLAQRLFP